MRTPPTYPQAAAVVTVGGFEVTLYRYDEFHASDVRRLRGNVAAAGTWLLPASIKEVTGRKRGAVEWVHATGEVLRQAPWRRLDPIVFCAY